jgi:hypothetical protein
VIELTRISTEIDAVLEVAGMPSYEDLAVPPPRTLRPRVSASLPHPATAFTRMEALDRKADSLVLKTKRHVLELEQRVTIEL